MADQGWLWLGQSASGHNSNKAWPLIEVWAQICLMPVHLETLGGKREALLVVRQRQKTASGNSKAS